MDRVAHHMAGRIGAQTGEPSRCLAAIFRPKEKTVHVVLASRAGGPDVSQIAAEYGGCGRPRNAFFSVAHELFHEMWAPEEHILWDVFPSGPYCLPLKRKEKVVV